MQISLSPFEKALSDWNKATKVQGAEKEMQDKITNLSKSLCIYNTLLINRFKLQDQLAEEDFKSDVLRAQIHSYDNLELTEYDRIKSSFQSLFGHKDFERGESLMKCDRHDKYIEKAKEFLPSRNDEETISKELPEFIEKIFNPSLTIPDAASSAEHEAVEPYDPVEEVFSSFVVGPAPYSPSL